MYSSNNLEYLDYFKHLSEEKLTIATPMYGGNCSYVYLLSMLDFFSDSHKINFYPELIANYNDALVTRARNNLIDQFLKTNNNYLIFIDADINFNGLDILRMLDFMKNRKDIGILVGAYPQKQINWPQITIANRLNMINSRQDYEKYSGKYGINFDFTNAELNFKEFDLYAPVEILDGSTGFMMIKREVFEKFKEAYPEQKYFDHDTDEEMFAYFDCKIDPDDNVYLSEDYMFTRWAKRIGIQTWLLPSIQLGHQGSYLFSGSYFAEAQLAWNFLPHNNLNS